MNAGFHERHPPAPGTADLERRFLDLEARRRLLPPGAHLLVGVSGGLDSVVLLHLLHRLAPRFDWTLAVGHVDHGLRETSSEDALFVERLARRLGLPFHQRRLGERLASRGLSEDAARQMRLGALEEMRRQAGADWIALAHTADDRVETILLNLLRGTGPRGLAAPPRRRGCIVRPLLELRRAELQAWARSLDLSWRVDASNWSTAFTRNWIRHRLLPLIAREASPRFVANIERLGIYMSRWCEVLDREVQTLLDRHARREGPGLVLEGIRPRDQGEWAVAELLHLAHRRVSPQGGQLTRRHIAACLKLLETGRPRTLYLPGGVRAEAGRGCIRLEPLAERAPRPVPTRVRLAPNPEGVEILGQRLRSRETTPGEARDRIAAKWGEPGTVSSWEAFDAAGLRGDLWVRPWRVGDRIRPLGMSGTKLVSDLLTDAYIAGASRRGVLVVGDDLGILWVVGVRRSDRAPLTAETRRVLELSTDPVA